MDFSSYMDSIVTFAQTHTVIAIIIALGLLIFLYRKPKLFSGLLFLGLFLAVVFYMIMSVAGTSSEQKKRMIYKEEKQTDSNP
jgi:cbb3-type cytochrome oxidase subunit 3